MMRRIPLSEIQEQFWILNKFNIDNPAYNLTSVFRIKGRINEAALESTIDQIINRHEILRTSFIENSGKTWQIINDEADRSFKLPVRYTRNPANDKIPDEVFDEIHKPFILEMETPVRVTLFRTGINNFILTVVFHHIISDFISKEIFLEELSSGYNARVKGLKITMNNPLSQYADYCLWQNDWIRSSEAIKMTDKWISEFRISELKLPYDFQPGKLPAEGKRRQFSISREKSETIIRHAGKNSTSYFVILLSLYSVFLHRLSGSPLVTIGVPFTNRRQEEFKNTLGCFTNILPVQIDFSDNPTFTTLVGRVRKVMLDTHRKQEIPFIRLNSSLAKEDQMIFNAGFTFEPPVQIRLMGTETIPVMIEKKGLQLDVFFTFWFSDNCFNLFFEYSTQLFDEKTIERFWNIFLLITKNALNNPDTGTGEIDILPEEDNSIIIKINNTDAIYEDKLCIHEKFEIQADEIPEAIALVTENIVMTYREFNEHANQMANYLISRGVNTEDKVGICMARSVGMMIAIYGVLKAGCAYLPLSPYDPEERLEEIITDANPRFVITDNERFVNFSSSAIILKTGEIDQALKSSPATNPGIKMNSRNLAYVIYTSGSTGRPKGAMIEHHSVLNRLEWMQKAYPIGIKDVLIQKTNITFDVSVWELFWWGFNGARLFLLPPGDEKNPEKIIECINDFKVTTIHFVPSMFTPFLQFVEIRSLFERIGSLKRIFLSGEPLPVQVVNDFNGFRISRMLPELINLYGPTEATVDVTYYNCPNSKIDRMYIGRPIDNTKLFVVNDRNKVQPVGTYGELIITGVSLARGYLNNPDMSSKKFFRMKAPGIGEIRGYRTGDFVRLTPDGQLEYFGRKDSQIKIRGFRIELGEIESKLSGHPSVKSCIAAVYNNKEIPTLIAYVIVRIGMNVSATTLKEYLISKLPGYMVPSGFVFVDKLPLTSNGKIDRKHLPAPDETIFRKNFSLKGNSFERRLFEIWSYILKNDNLGMDDNFFEAGGNSLQAINSVNLIVKEFGISISMTAIFQYPTIRKLSKFLSANRAGISENLSHPIIKP